MNNEPSYIMINLDGVRINIRLRSGVTLLSLVPKMTGSWSHAEYTSPIVRGLNVTNDAAERGVALIQSFNRSITTNEERKQFLLQIVKEHRRSLPNSNKSKLVQNFEDLQ